ncbi:MAG TPA: PKD-like domain-containing protein, partial [Candidatus Saccharimonadales bacterium]
MYLSRTSGGNTCDSQYIYYDPANTGGYNFEAYIVGNTVELNNSTWTVSPTLTCGNDCSLTLTATIDYGVPPYTISHPWAGSSVTVGSYDTTICGSTGSATITLTIPNCPLTSCTSTLLTVPPPTITDACGTSVQGLTDQFITVKPVPTVVATPDSVETCSGSPFNISLSSCVSGTTYTWTGSDGSSGSGSTIVDSVLNSTGVAKIVDFTITPSAGGCTGTPVVIKATIEPIPTSPFTITPSKICVNTNAVVTYSGTKINGAVYNWNFGGGSLVSGSSTGPGPDSILFTTTGSHTITLSVTANGCTSTTTSNTVTVIPGPVITVSPKPVNICAGNSADLSASGGNLYFWSPSTGLNSTTASSVIASPTSSTIYSVEGIDVSDGCATTVKDTVNVNAKPVIRANPSPAAFCVGGSSVITATGGTSYTWSPSIGLSATTGSSVTANPSSTKKYVVTGTNVSGCSSTDTITVTVNPLPIITATPSPASYCPGGSSTLTASG